MSTEENKAIVRRYVDEVLNDEQLGVVDELFAFDCVLQDPNLGEERQGSDVMAALARVSHVVSPDYNVRVEETVAEGDTVMISWMASGKLAPEMGDPGPTGDEVTVSGISMFRFNDEGRISYTKQLSRSLDDYPRPVPKEEAARERLANDPVLGRLGDVAVRPKCWVKPWTCLWGEPDQV
jgi:SnoaL-like protein